MALRARKFTGSAKEKIPRKLAVVHQKNKPFSKIADQQLQMLKTRRSCQMPHRELTDDGGSTSRNYRGRHVDLIEVQALVERIHTQTANLIHDGIGQSLTGVSLLMHSLCLDLQTGDKNAVNATLAKAVVEQLASILVQVRALSTSCAPNAGSKRALDDLIEDYRQLVPIQRRKQMTFEFDSLPDTVQDQALQAVKSFFMTVIKPVLAWDPTGTVKLRLGYRDGQLELIINCQLDQSEMYPQILGSLEYRLIELKAQQINGTLSAGLDASCNLSLRLCVS